ncbi:MAG: hypothetical protein JXJ20_10780 [Anaerolineae bacterium]|nr:hypothetical protein [Anaerolineae bacterium]
MSAVSDQSSAHGGGAVLLYQSDSEVLFPPRVIASLAHLRGDVWQALVAYILNCRENDPDALAFDLLMIRLNSCLTCHPGSYRSVRGCTFCARQAVRRFKGADDDLIRQWDQARGEVLRWLTAGEPPPMD